MVSEQKSNDLTLSSERKSQHSDIVKRNLVSRLNRIEGQVQGVKGLVEKEFYYGDVITQISAIQASLKGVEKILFECHLKHCVLVRVNGGNITVLDDVLVTIQRLMKK